MNRHTAETLAEALEVEGLDDGSLIDPRVYGPYPHFDARPTGGDYAGPINRWTPTARKILQVWFGAAVPTPGALSDVLTAILPTFKPMDDNYTIYVSDSPATLWLHAHNGAGGWTLVSPTDY